MIDQEIETGKNYHTVTIIFVLLIIIVTITSFYYYSQTKQNLMTEKFAEVKAIAGQKSERVSNWIGERKAEGKYLATNSVLTESITNNSFMIDAEGRHRITELFEQLRANHNYSTISLIDLKGNFLVRTGDSIQPVNPATEFNAADTGRIAIISTKGLSDSIPYLTFLTPVFSPANIKTGYVFQKIDIRIDAKLIFESVTPDNDPYQMKLFYFNDGKIYSLLDSSQITTVNSGESEKNFPDEIFEAGNAGKSGRIQVSGFNDLYTLGYLKKLSNLDIFVYCGVSGDQLEQPLKPIFLLLTIIIVITIILSALAISLVIKRQEVSYSQKIAESRAFLESIREGMSDGFVVFDSDLKFLAVNSKAISVIGKTKGEIIGKSALDVLPDLRNSGFYYSFAEVKKTGKPYTSIDYYPAWDIYFQNKLFPVTGGFAVFFSDITGEIKLKEQLKETYRQLEGLTLHMQVVAENDREAIAREIHDELGQVLTSLKMNLAMMKNAIKAGNQGDQGEFLLEEINTMGKQIDATVKRIRRIITELRPEVLDHLGFVAAIEWLVEESPAKNLIDYKFSSNVEHLDLDKTTATSLFRIVQEACTNINRHSGAKNAAIKIEKQNDKLVVTITDDGKGFFVNDLKGVSTFGLLGMRERAKLINAELGIESAENKGTTISISVELKNY